MTKVEKQRKQNGDKEISGFLENKKKKRKLNLTKKNPHSIDIGKTSYQTKKTFTHVKCFHRYTEKSFHFIFSPKSEKK